MKRMIQREELELRTRFWWKWYMIEKWKLLVSVFKYENRNDDSRVLKRYASIDPESKIKYNFVNKHVIGYQQLENEGLGSFKNLPEFRLQDRYDRFFVPKYRKLFKKFRSTVGKLIWLSRSTETSMEDIFELQIMSFNNRGNFAVKMEKLVKSKNEISPEEQKHLDKKPKASVFDASISYLFSLIPQNNFKNLVHCIFTSQNLTKFTRDKHG